MELKMNDRNKILSQILLIANQYEIEILSIDFRNITISSDEIKVKFKIENDKFIVKWTLIINFLRSRR